LLVTLLLPIDARASFPGQNGRIAYQSVQDGNPEIYSVNPDGTGSTRLTNHGAADETPAWSPDGTKIAFSNDASNQPHIFTMNADGSRVTQLTSVSSDREPAWSPEGHKIVFRAGPVTNDALWMMTADGTDQQFLFSTNHWSEQAPAWSPTGEPIVFEVDEAGFNPGIWKFTPGDTYSAVVEYDGKRPDWSPDGKRLVFESIRDVGGLRKGLNIVDPISGGGGAVPGTTDLMDPVYSPDGTRIAATDGGSIYTLNVDGTDRRLVTAGTSPSWQAIDPPPYPGPSYPRPRGATPMQVPLVPVYLGCSSPNNTHGSPFALASCSPPQLGTWNLTMGTSDANGAGARFVGSLFFQVIAGDVRVTADLTDVRCKYTVEPDPETEGFPCRAGEMADYVGEIQGYPLVRITDQRNGWEANRPGTVRDVRFPFTIPCVATPSDLVGSNCHTSTTFNSVLPGTLEGGARAVWAVQRADVYDGGADGVAATQSNNGPFVTQGLFIP
jgi:TolB protein